MLLPEGREITFKRPTPKPTKPTKS
jgi:hypothetical protein